jgi:hypothetical protein
LNFCTVDRRKSKFVLYVSCELAVRKNQIPSGKGRFELMCHCNDEKWVRNVLTTIGQMSLESRFDHLHTIDISPIGNKRARLQGAILERFATVKIKSHEYSILRVHGVTKDELERAMKNGAESLLEHLKTRGVYLNTDVKRKSTL